MGPVGILVAFQAVVAGIEIFAQKSKKAKEETQEFSNELVLQGEVLRALRNDFLDGDNSIEKRIELLQTLAITDKNLQNILNDGTLTEEERIKKGEEYVDNIRLIEEEEMKLMAAKKQIEEEERSIDELRAERAEKEAERIALKAILEQNALNQVGLGAQIEIGIRNQQINNLDDLISKYDYIQQQTLAIDNLRKSIQVEEVKREEEVAEAIEETTIALEEQVELLGQRRFAVIGTDLFKGPKKTDAQKWAEKELGEFASEVVNEFQDRVRSEGDTNLFIDLFGISQERFAETAAQVQQGLDTAFNLINSGFEKELALEERKTIALNDQLRARLRNEQLTADARDKINQEIARNEAKLVEKQNEIEEKRFKLNKAQGIANAVINTAVAVTKVFPNVPMMAFIGALGAAQIATIANQQFVPQAMPSPNLTAQGAIEGAGAPQIDTVGASGVNQLLEAISAQLDRPVKTYVVAGDVTTAQSLDRNIITEAGI